MKKLVAAVLTGVLVAGTLSTGVYAKDDDKTITVAASAAPHAEIMKKQKPILEEGYDLEVTVFDDYVRPNEVVESGEFDANYFQHIPYLDQFNEGTHLVNAGGIVMSHSEFIREQKTAWMTWKMEILSQYQMIQQMKQEHFFFSRTTESSH